MFRKTGKKNLIRRKCWKKFGKRFHKNFQELLHKFSSKYFIHLKNFYKFLDEIR